MTGEKIDAALKAKAVLRELVAFKANYEKQSCDKKGCVVSIPAKDSYMGYYGNSSCSSWPVGVCHALAEAIQGRISVALSWAIERAKREVARLVKEAEADAKDVLAALSEPVK